MNTQIDALFAEHEDPTHTAKQALRDQLSPIAQVSDAALKQVLEYRSLLTQVELSDHDESLDPVIEHIRQTLGAADREARAFAESGRALAFAFTQLDQKMVRAKSDVAAVLARVADTPPIVVADSRPVSATTSEPPAP